MATERPKTDDSYERLLDRETSEDDIQHVYHKLKDAGYGARTRSAPIVRNDRRKEQVRRDGPSASPSRKKEGAGAPQGRRAADHFPPVEPRHRRRVNRWAASQRLLITGPRERFYDFVSVFRPSTPDLVNPRLLDALAPRSGYLDGNPYTFSLATTFAAIRALARTLMGVPPATTSAARSSTGAGAPAPERSSGPDPGERHFATLRKRDPFALELLMRLAQERPELVSSFRYLELARSKRTDIAVASLARVARETWALKLVTEQLSTDALGGVFHAVQEVAAAVGYPGQSDISVSDACDILGVCIENLDRFAAELYPVVLKATGKFFAPAERSEEKQTAMRAFTGVRPEEILTREAFQEAMRRRREEERARQEQIELETAARGEASGMQATFGPTLRILGSMFPDSGLERIDQSPYLLPYFDNRVFTSNLPFSYGTATIDRIARLDPLQLVLILHRILDNVLAGVNAHTIEQLLDRHGITESFDQIVVDWRTAYDSLLAPYVRAVNEYARIQEDAVAGAGEETPPSLRSLTEEIVQLRNRAIKGYGGAKAAKQTDGLRLWSLAERLTLLLDLVGEEINPDVARREDPVGKKIYRSIAMDPVYDFAAGASEDASVQKPVVRQLRRYVEAKYRSGLASVPRIAQLFAIDFLRALAELYRFLLNDDLSPLRAAANEIPVAGEDEAEVWKREHATRSGGLDDRLRIRLDEHADSALTDAMTGLRTKEFFLRKLPAKFAALAKAGKPISIIMADIDHFKWVNDSLGHQTGDLVLKDASRTILDGVRRGQDAAIRYGGEEIMILTAAPLHTAAALAERLRRTQAEHVADRDLYSEIKEIGRERAEACGTFSLGVVERAANENLEACVERADKALYAAKESRNGVAVGHVGAGTDGTVVQRVETFSDYLSRVRRQARSERGAGGQSN